MTGQQPVSIGASMPDFRTFALRPRRSRLRWLLAAAAAAVAAAHVPVIGPHLVEAPYMGALFVVLTVGCLVIGITALIRDPAGLYALATVTCGLAVVGYAATRLIAFPMLADDVGNWLEPLGIVSVLGELMVIATAMTALRQGTFTRRCMQHWEGCPVSPPGDGALFRDQARRQPRTAPTDAAAITHRAS